MREFLMRPVVLMLVGALAASGCETMGMGMGSAGGSARGEQVGYGSEQSLRYGTITRIEATELESDAQLGLGAVLGAAAGGILGHQIGSGTGQDVATVLGVIGGAVAVTIAQAVPAEAPEEASSCMLTTSAAAWPFQPMAVMAVPTTTRFIPPAVMAPAAEAVGAG